MVELKQWSAAQADPEDPELVSRRCLRPSARTSSGVRFRTTSTTWPISSKRWRTIRNPCGGRLLAQRDGDRDRIFAATNGDRGQPTLHRRTAWRAWLEYLASTLGPSPGAPAADLLLSSAVAPSRQLMKVAADEIQQREQFTLLDEQEVALPPGAERGEVRIPSRSQVGDRRDRWSRQW